MLPNDCRCWFEIGSSIQRFPQERVARKHLVNIELVMGCRSFASNNHNCSTRPMCGLKYLHWLVFSQPGQPSQHFIQIIWKRRELSDCRQNRFIQTVQLTQSGCHSQDLTLHFTASCYNILWRGVNLPYSGFWGKECEIEFFKKILWKIDPILV